MKDREKQILEWIIQEQKVSIKELLGRLSVSKRTLYYDIESINFHIRSCGQVKNLDGSFVYIGPYHSLEEIFARSGSEFENSRDRFRYIVYKILNNERISIDSLSEEMGFSRNTVVQTLDEIKSELKESGLVLKAKPCYQITGDENEIRSLYLLLMQEDNNLLNFLEPEVVQFDKEYSTSLTDYSLSGISKFTALLKQRIKEGYRVGHQPYFQEAKELPFYPGVKKLLPEADPNEQAYLCAYIASCPGRSPDVNELIDGYVEKLISRFEARSAVQLDNKEEFTAGIRRHLLSSYYRIKFHFPIYNPILSDIKYKHPDLFRIIRSILEKAEDFPDFTGIREEEIGFIAAYVGGFLKSPWLTSNRRNRVLLVCPNGLMISRNLEIQLYQSIPMIDIVDVIALKDLKGYDKPYDTIVSTVTISDYPEVIVVNPLLTKMDIDRLMNRIVDIRNGSALPDVDRIMEVVEQFAEIKDGERLRTELLKLFYQDVERGKKQPMLKDLLTEKRIFRTTRLKDWKDAIAYASRPLLQDGSIEQAYVDGMIEAVEEHGPYIVLADGFALPHASNKAGVNRLAMAMLVVEEPVDLLGKPVNLFVVLATVDNTTHIKALASLTELLYDPKNMEIFRSGDSQAILEVIHQKENGEVKG